MRTSGGFLAIVLTSLLVACGGSGPGSTPEDSFSALQNALQSEDYESLADLMPPKQREKMQKQFDDMKKQMEGPAGEQILKGLEMSKDEFNAISTPEEFMAIMLEKMAEEDSTEIDNLKKAEVVDSKVDGEKASLKVKAGDFEKTIRLVKVDDLWYIDSM